MPEFKFAAQVVVSAYTTVTADNADEAMEIARERSVVIGGPNTGESESEDWIVDDIDGEPTGIYLSHEGDE